MKRKLQTVLSIILSVVIVTATWLPAFSISIAPPRATLVVPQAVPVEESVMCSCVIYSANGLSENLKLNENHFSLSGTGKAKLSDFETISGDGLTVTVRFKLTGTYPGEIKINILPDSVFDKAGMSNSTTTVPKYIDIKLFNTDGENAHQKMSEGEYFITVMVAPFWYMLNLIGLV